ncbi:MAG: pyruvate dehydrogenase complex E1 component subunit beta, partial [Gemmatimonadetes bacterium]|nr:pyruvate dehydrogenase complex E1 component subunit beta [Gemmatimonadota bacterium]
ERLAAEDGLEAEVVDLRTVRPVDLSTVLESVRKTNRVVVAEEGWPVANVGAQLADDIQREAFDDLDAPVARVSALDVPVPYARNLETLVVPSADHIVAAARHVGYIT